MNRHSWKKTAFELLLILLVSLVPLLWFRPGTLMVGHDHVAPLDPKVFLQGRLSTWNDQFFGQSQALILGTILIHFIDVIPSYLGFSLVTGQKIVFVFWFFMIGVSAYVLASVIKPRERIFKLVTAILYQFNFFILQGWWIGEKSKFSAYISLPLVLSIYLLVESGKLPVLTGAIINSFILFFFNAGGLYGLPLHGGLFVVIACFIVFSLISNWYNRNSQVFKRILWLTVGTVVLTVAINGYYIVPAWGKLRTQLGSGISQVGGVSGILSWADEISANTSFVNLMRFQGIAEWYDNPEHPYAKIFLTNPLLIAVSFLWPLLAFASLYAVKVRQQRRLILYFFFVYLVGMFFAAGTHPPLGFLYELMVRHIPGFIIFRSPYFKFAPALYLSQAFLIALFLDSLSVKMRKIASFGLIGLVLVYHFPFFTGNFFEWRKGFSTRIAVPEYVFSFGQWLNQQEGKRVLLLPPNSPNLQYGLYEWGYLSFQALPTLLSNASVIVNNDRLNKEELTLTMELYEAIREGQRESVQKFVSLLGVTHVLLQRDMVSAVQSSIPLEVGSYTQGLAKTNLFALEQTFGQWEVYRYTSDVLPTVALAPRVEIVRGELESVPEFLEYLSLPSNFLLTSDLGESSQPAALVIPACLSCPQKGKPIVVFPERNILPGDPFYALVLLSESMRLRTTDPKSSIYNKLGISLKRISEINEMLFQQKPLTQEIVDRYTQLLASIEEDFGRLSTLQERIEVASDVRHYLRAQRNYLRPNLGKYVTGGLQTVFASKIFSAIYKTEQLMELSAAPLEKPGSRLYQFNLDTSGSFQIVVKGKDVEPLAKEKSQIRLNIDDTARQELRILPTTSDKWLSFGTFQLNKGFHTLRLALPSVLEKTYPLQSIETEFSAKGENACFGSRVSDLTSGKLYNITLEYLNDFSDNLLLFLWRKDQEIQRLETVAKLQPGPFTLNVRQIYEVPPRINEITVALCAPDFTAEQAQKQFTLQVGEVIYPGIALVAAEKQTAQVLSVDYQKRGPTQYDITLPDTITPPTVLTFSERFDPWWELHGLSARHIRLDGYANAWIIDDIPTNKVTLVYKGESYLRWGALLTSLTLLGGLVWILKSRRQRD